jgi:glutaredoxin
MTVDIYTSNSCAYCKQVKQYLNLKGKTYNEINVEEHPERREEMVKLSGANFVPVTVVRDGERMGVVSGYNLPKLSTLLN